MIAPKYSRRSTLIGAGLGGLVCVALQLSLVSSSAQAPDSRSAGLPKVAEKVKPGDPATSVLAGTLRLDGQPAMPAPPKTPGVGLVVDSLPALGSIPETGSMTAPGKVSADLAVSLTKSEVPNHVMASTLRADGGDDQVGIVGRQITLNGSRSEPSGQVGFRWIQVAGPRVRLELCDGYIYSFVPQAPGVYEFVLVVARGSEISVPDRVTVSVGNPSSPFGIEPTPEVPEALHEVARAALGMVPGGIDLGPALGEAFDGVADRMDLYRSYAEAYSELSRRLEPLLPTDSVRRLVWTERVFSPLTVRLIEGLRAEGLDLRTTEGQYGALTSTQRARSAELFRAMARGFRATQLGR